MRLAAGVIWVFVFLACACGGNPPSGGSPPASPSGTNPTATQPCGQPSAIRSSGIFLASAALLRATVVVDNLRSPSPRCTTLQPGQTVNLHIGDRVQFVANNAPALNQASPEVVAVTTSPGPVQSGPGGGSLTTSHVIVTLTAEHPGTVEVGPWVDCSGTGC